jgi:hypothetical protein
LVDDRGAWPYGGCNGQNRDRRLLEQLNALCNAISKRLRGALSERAIRVQFYIPGFLDPNLAYGVRTPLPKADSHRLVD